MNYRCYKRRPRHPNYWRYARQIDESAFDYDISDRIDKSIRDQEDIGRMLRAQGLASEGLEPLPDELERHCFDCGRQMRGISLDHPLSTIICPRCRDLEKARQQYRREREEEKRNEALVESLTRALAAALDARRLVPGPPPGIRLKPTERLKLYWISWRQPIGLPQRFAEPTQICAWWYSGYSIDDGFLLQNICACVMARSVKEAKFVISGGWPRSPEWRFCDRKPDHWRPSAKEFPIGHDGEQRFQVLQA